MHATTIRDHWWWRPGWRVGRRFYTWHVTFARDSELHALVHSYQEVIRAVPGLDLIPKQWLHLTTQGVGFVDEVSADDLASIVEAVRSRVGHLPAARVSFGTPVVNEESVVLPVRPKSALQGVRSEIQAGIADVWGRSKTPESDKEFMPHVSLAYPNIEQSSAPVIAALESVRPTRVTLDIKGIDLISLGRDGHLYEWSTIATVATRCGTPQ
ncbi:2'-5' RNA ligase family protein [Actinokineospora sp. 24-640]